MNDITTEEVRIEETKNTKINFKFLVLLILSVVLLVAGIIGISFILPVSLQAENPASLGIMISMMIRS